MDEFNHYEVIERTKDEVLDYLGEQDSNPQFGAHPLKRVLQCLILNELPRGILAGWISKNSVVEEVLKDGKYVSQTWI